MRRDSSARRAFGARRRAPSIALAALTALALTLSASFYAPPALPAAAQSDAAPVEIEPVTISGKIINGTAGASPPETLTVRLFSSVNSSGGERLELEEQRMETVTNARGEFEFTDVILTGDLCQVVAFAEAFLPTYNIQNCVDRRDIELKIWEITNSLDDITLDNYNIIFPAINRADRELLVLASAEIVNSSDRIWVNDTTDPNLSGPDFLRFNLPLGFFNASVEEFTSQRGVTRAFFESIDTGIALFTPILPTESETTAYTVLISFAVPYSGNVFKWPLRLPHGANSVTISFPADAGEVSGDGLEFIRKDEVNNAAVNLYRGESYAKLVQINLTISGLPQPTWYQALGAFFSSAGFIWTISIALGALLLAILALVLARRRANDNIDIDEFEP